jgi:hypothetical protein|tara:strand:+ start:8037 stop:8270 length:234 start_codon:yes stop_codon:yes gene_type:complete
MVEKGLIDYESLEVPIKKIEELLGEFNTEEKLLVLSHVTQRINSSIRDFKQGEQTTRMFDKLGLTSMLKNLKQNKEE